MQKTQPSEPEANQPLALSLCSGGAWLKGALCAEVIRPGVAYNQNDETLSRNSLRYLSKANLLIAVH